MPKRTTSIVKKKLPKISGTSGFSNQAKVKPMPVETLKPFNIELDEFIIENAIDHIKMFAKPDANLSGEKQFKIKITKDEQGKAQFDIIFIKTPGEITGCHDFLIPSDRNIMTTFTVSPEHQQIDLIQTTSTATSNEQDASTSLTSTTSNSPFWLNRPQGILNFLENPYHREIFGGVHIRRYENIRAEFLKENADILNRIPGLQNTFNAQTHFSNVTMPYNPELFTDTNTEDFTPPVSQLKPDSIDSYLIEDEKGRQFLVRRLTGEELVNREKQCSENCQIVSNEESKHNQTDERNLDVPVENKIGLDAEAGESVHFELNKSQDSKTRQVTTDTRNVSDPKPLQKTIEHQSNKKKSVVDIGTWMDPNDRPNFTDNSVIQSESSSRTVTGAYASAMQLPTPTPNDAPSTTGSSIKIEDNQKSVNVSATSSTTLTSEMNFVIASACAKIPKSKKTQVRAVVSEILNYFDCDLIKSLMGQKINDEREFIIEYMNHKGKYGLKKMEYINRLLQDRSLSEEEILEKTTKKMDQINKNILDLLDHKICNENHQVTEIVQEQLKKSKSLILKETCQECFIAIKYCTLQTLQDQLRTENERIRREVEMNLRQEMETALRRIKSMGGT